MNYLLPALLASASPALAATPGALDPKPATGATIDAQKATAASLPIDDGRDAAFADQGFVATRSDPIIRAADGRPIWNLEAYAWMDGEAPATVNPSLWRHMKLLRKHGLYKVADDIWQVRGFDVSNMTVVKGATGWILIDPLTTREAAAAAIELVNQQLGQRPVTGVIYSHSHGDHYGGVRGVITDGDAKSGKVAVIAPEHFVEEASSENVLAGPAMGRRANYQFGAGLTPGPQGQMGSGIGKAISGGAITLMPPTT
jgi:alkyl sulfatase BDS1-like metallo-beta-lactamase superfamily hydrolase